MICAGNRRWLFAAAMVVLLTAVHSEAWAQKKVGPEFRVNSYTKSLQTDSSVAKLEKGGFVVTWSSYGLESRFGVYAQRYDDAGIRLRRQFRVNTTTQADQHESSVAGLKNGAGDFVVVWTSRVGTTLDILGQRFTASGARIGGEFKVNASLELDQRTPKVAALEDGGFVVVWHAHTRWGLMWDVWARRFNAAGVAQGPEFRVNTAGEVRHSYPAVAGLRDGGFVVVWGDVGIMARRYTADSVAGVEFQVNKTMKFESLFPAGVAGLTNGGFVVIWNYEDGRFSPAKPHLFARRYNARGVAIGDPFRANTKPVIQELRSALAALDDGGFVVAWESQPFSHTDVFGQRYGAAGLPIGGAFQLNSPGVTNQLHPALAGLTNGNFVATWDSGDQDGDEIGIFGQLFSR